MKVTRSGVSSYFVQIDDDEMPELLTALAISSTSVNREVAAFSEKAYTQLSELWWKENQKKRDAEGGTGFIATI